MKAYIKGISYYLPERERTNQELSEKFPEWGVEKIAKKIGVKTRHIAAENEFASDLAIAASRKLFEQYKIAPSEIDFILYCTQSPDFFLPTTACILQNKLNIPSKAGALDFNLGCSGFIYGLAIAKGLVAAKIAKNILLITAETYSKFIHETDKGNQTIFGDAGAATLVSIEGFAEIRDFELGTDGSGAENLIVKEGGIRFREKTGSSNTDSYGNVHAAECLFMNGPEIFNFTSDQIPPLVERTLKMHELVKDDIDQFILHQANRYMLDHLRKKMRIAEANFYISMEDVGNTVSSTIPIALQRAVAQLQPRPGAQWLLSGFGVGYSWGATVIKFV